MADDGEPHGSELHLDLDNGEGWLRVRDSTPQARIRRKLDALRPLGWKVVDEDEGVEPYEFEDGEWGVQIWLHRPVEPLAFVLHTIGKATDGDSPTGRGAGTWRHAAA